MALPDLSKLRVHEIGNTGELTYTRKYFVDTDYCQPLTEEQLVFLCDKGVLYSAEAAKEVADLGGYFGGRIERIKIRTGIRYIVYVYID
jgi:hypothetical protein